MRHPTTRLRSLARKLALATASTLVALLALELGMRLVGLEVHDFMNERRKYDYLLFRDPAGRYMRHPASACFVLQDVEVCFNSLGMRDREPGPKEPGRFRVLCLGDSVTFGPGVAQDAIYPARLQALLGPGAEVVTAGVQGWNTVEEERFLAAHAGELSPDLVVLLYIVNDNEPIEPWRREKPPPTHWSSRIVRTLVLRSRLFEWVAFVYKSRIDVPNDGSVAELVHWRRDRAAAGAPFAPTEPGWLESRTALTAIAGRMRETGGRLVIFLYNLDGREPAPAALARLREFGAETGVPVFDTLPFFAGHDPLSLINRRVVDPHPNAAGHALLADGIARTLAASGLVPPVR